jgi:hypothetical protein
MLEGERNPSKCLSINYYYYYYYYYYYHHHHHDHHRSVSDVGGILQALESAWLTEGGIKELNV